jgi:polygalacturonase
MGVLGHRGHRRGCRLRMQLQSTTKNKGEAEKTGKKMGRSLHVLQATARRSLTQAGSHQQPSAYFIRRIVDDLQIDSVPSLHTTKGGSMIGRSLGRRNFLKKAGQSLLAAPILNPLAKAAIAQTPPRPGNQHGKTVQPNPRAPKVSLNIRDFGATGDGTTKDTAAIQQAIDRCAVFGGGEVLVPAGNYLTGAIALRSNTLLRLDKDASILGTPDFADYPVTQVRWEGKWISGHTALIYALDANNIGIVGSGKIVGDPALGGRPRPDSPLRHPALIETINCSHLRFEDFSTSYHLMWSLHPTCGENIVIKNLTIRSTGGNGDGIDIDSCKHVLIDNCDIATGDDCISLKSGRGSEGYAQLNTTEDVTITNCTFADSIFACIGIGSETSGGIRNVRIESCKFTLAKTFAIYIKSRPGRGAFIEDIVANDLDVSGTAGGASSASISSTVASRTRSPYPAMKASRPSKISVSPTSASKTCLSSSMEPASIPASLSKASH